MAIHATNSSLIRRRQKISWQGDHGSVHTFQHSFDWFDLLNVDYGVALREGYYASDLNTYCANIRVPNADKTVTYGLAHDGLFNISSTVGKCHHHQYLCQGLCKPSP